MKRTAAIIGPTPPFIRWAIDHACELRELDKGNLPSSTFRQLRAIKELDLATREQRVFQGVAFHPDTRVGHDLVGFLPGEVSACVGGQTAIESHCGDCPANANRDVEGWVGCFGMAQVSGTLMDRFAETIERMGGDERLKEPFEVTSPNWFGLWTSGTMGPERIKLLAELLGKLDLDDEWLEFRRAVNVCEANSLTLHVDYFPAGESDGIRWRLNPHCSFCKWELNDQDRQKCPCCGQAVVAQSQRKRKVLGLRPYMQMKFVLGETKSQQLVLEYVAWKKGGQDRSKETDPAN